ncbi:hypothetical protein SO802_017959 [Lithocarpus litseifolius]|uniref:Uncharacterized protein n=1 Tax=Lithocarpus litseifolius TaxID=425828 RepID=A0AAW2CJC9_9ROSI
MQTFSPTKTVSFELATKPVLSKEPLRGTTPSIQEGQTSVQSAPKATSSLESEGSEGVDIGVKGPELVVPKVDVEFAPDVQRVESSLILAGGDTTMGEAPEVTASDPGSGLPTFLAHFDLLEFNSLPASHFHRFGPPFGNFLRFSVPMEGLPLLEGLFKIHGDFTSGFRGGVFLSNILMKLSCAVLISLRYSSLDSLFEEKLLEWRGVVQDLIEAKFNMSFLLKHLCSLAHMLFQRQASRSLDAEIVTAEEALARAHKVL